MLTVFYDIKGVVLINWLSRANHLTELISIKSYHPACSYALNRRASKWGIIHTAPYR
jgi:hypothetical protein